MRPPHVAFLTDNAVLPIENNTYMSVFHGIASVKIHFIVVYLMHKSLSIFISSLNMNLIRKRPYRV